MRTAQVCTTEQSAVLVKHREGPKSCNSHSKTRFDPAASGGAAPASERAPTAGVAKKCYP